MANTFTAVGLVLQVTGENSGTWGTYLDTNENITTLLIGGTSTQTITTTDVTPANVNGTADAGKNLTFVCSGVLTGNRKLIVPTEGRQYIVTNNCTGAFTLTVTTVAGTGVRVPQTGTANLYCDGTNILPANSAALLTVGAITGTTFDAGVIGGITPVQAQGYYKINAQTGTTYTFALLDNGQLVTANNAGATTYTIPTHATIAFPPGTRIDLLSINTGILTISPAVGVTLASKGSKVTLTGNGSGGSLINLATDSWELVGDLA